jgi:low temperature requirement protein LtrA
VGGKSINSWRSAVTLRADILESVAPAVIHASLRRTGREAPGVTKVELFYDLVYAFAVTQLSHYLVDHATVEGALQTTLLVAMVWLAWAYTTWVTNWLDPDRFAVRLLLVALALVSLVMSVGLPNAFGSGGVAVGAAYAVMQVGRTIFTVFALRRDPLEKTFQRILAWCVVSGSFAVAGGLAQGHAREILWVLAASTDILGGAVRFYTPGLGRSETREWDLEGSLFADRCQSFLLIALGESIVVMGATLSSLPTLTPTGVVAMLVAFVGAVMIWWIYFDRTADSEQIVALSSDPGRLGQIAYHLIHPIMVAGIIAFAAGQRTVLAHPLDTVAGPSALMTLGGCAIYLAGHALFKAQVFNVWSRQRLIGTVVLLAGALIGPQLPALMVSVFAAVTLMAVVIADRVTYREHQG